MLQIDRFKKNHGKKHEGQMQHVQYHSQGQPGRKEFNSGSTGSRLFPAIAEQYRAGTRVLWSGVITGQGTMIVANSDIVADLSASHPPGTTHPSALSVLQKLSLDSKSIAVQNKPDLATLFPVQTGCEKFDIGPRPDISTMERKFFKVPAARYGCQKELSTLPKTLLVDLRRPLPSLGITTTSHTPSIPLQDDKIDPSSPFPSESAPPSEVLTEPLVLGVAISSGTTDVITESTQSDSVITQEIDLSNNSNDTFTISTLDGTYSPSLGSVHSIQCIDTTNDLKLEMMGYINGEYNSAETPSQAGPDTASISEPIVISVQEREVIREGIPKLPAQPNLPVTSVWSKGNLSLDDLVKGERLACGGTEEHPSKNNSVVIDAVKNNSKVGKLPLSSSPKIDTVDENMLGRREGISVKENEAGPNMVDLPVVKSFRTGFGERAAPGSILKKQLALINKQMSVESLTFFKNVDQAPPSDRKLSNLSGRALPPVQKGDQVTIPAGSSSFEGMSHTPITIPRNISSQSIVSHPICSAQAEPKVLPPHLRPKPQPIRKSVEDSDVYILPHLRCMLLPDLRPAHTQQTPVVGSARNSSRAKAAPSVSKSSQTSSGSSPNSTQGTTKGLATRRGSDATEASDDCVIGAAKDIHSDTSESSGVKTPKEPDIEFPVIVEASTPPRSTSFKNHSPVRTAQQTLSDAQINTKSQTLVTAHNSGRECFLRTEKGFVELPVMYTFCDDKHCSFRQNYQPCEKSHVRSPQYYIPFNEPVCSEFILHGSCSTSGKRCLHGAHPCPSEIRFNKCHKRSCPNDHSITISPSGGIYSVFPGQPEAMPTINTLQESLPAIIKDRTEYNLDPPGLSTRLGPRSDNDWYDFTRISILPTVDEIISTRPIYLPHKGSMSSAHGVFEVGFRHQREAVLGQVRLALSHLIKKMLRGEKFITGSQGGQDPVYRVYKNCVVTHGFVEQCRIPTLNFGLRFSSPGGEQIRDEAVLRSGHLLALLIQSTKDISLVWLQATQHWSNRDENGNISNIGRVNVKAINKDTQKGDLEKFLSLQANQKGCLLVDFGGVLPATFMNVLSAIQKLNSGVRSFFAKNLFQGEIPDIMRHTPTYLHGQEIDFSSLGFQYKCRFTPGQVGRDVLGEIKKRLSQKNSEGVTFTVGQIEALVNSFTSRLSFIQGPPGTGKSFIGRLIITMLAVNRRAWKNDKTTPILLTAQTNHALDETIAGYIKSGLKVARLGITPGSQAARPEHIAFQNHALPKEVYEPIHKAYNQARNQAEASSRELEFLISELTNSSVAWRRLGPFLQKEHLEFYKAFVKTSGGVREAEGFISWSNDEQKIQPSSLLAGLKATIPEGFQGSGLKINELEISPQDSSSADEKDEGLDLWKFTPSERQELISGWKKDLDSTLNHNIEIARATLEESSRNMRIFSAKEKAAKIIGFGIDVVACTSTRAASEMELLKHLEIEVAIVEEAAEIVEPMVLPIFGSTLQQLIMIGDHQQLKPFCDSPGLAGGYYKQDQSLFERLVSPSAGTPSVVPLALLDCQRRMRPELAGLVRSLGVYKSYTDGDNVKSYPDVPGMGGKNLLWLGHNSPESFSGRSYYNNHEADMIAGHAAHLIRYGELGIRDVVILTPYREQVAVIIKALKKQGAFGLTISAEDMNCLAGRNAEYNLPQESEQRDFTWVNVDISDAIQVTTIDNYQGQEANVILYSAVRSNNDGRLGFTDITNRACVTLSRARHGMYIFGNADTAQNSKDSWSRVIKYMKDQRLVVTDLPVQQCSHSGQTHMIRCPADWERLRHIECDKLRSSLLPCGHIVDFPCGTRETQCPDCKKALEENTPLVSVTDNSLQNIDVAIFPLHISGLDLEGTTETTSVSGHEQWFLSTSRYFLSNAEALKDSQQNGVPSRTVFLQSLNLSRSGDKENEWRFAERYAVLRSFHDKYEIGLRQAAIVERDFGKTGLVSRMRDLKHSIRDAIADDYNFVLSELMKMARPHNNVRKIAQALRQALKETFE